METLVDSMETLAGVIIGFILGLVPPWYLRHRRLKAHFAALKCEIEICADLAATYLKDNVRAPVYRLPLQAYSASLPALLADGAISAVESKALTQYYLIVMELNRGLDNADHFHKVENHKLIDLEYNRNRNKAEKLKSESPRGVFEAAITAVKSRL